MKRLKVSNGEMEDTSLLPRKRKVRVGEDEENIGESVEDIVTLEESWREPVCVLERGGASNNGEDLRRDRRGSFQAQRKFASSHTPTVK